MKFDDDRAGQTPYLLNSYEENYYQKNKQVAGNSRTKWQVCLSSYSNVSAIKNVVENKFKFITVKKSAMGQKQ